MFDIDLIWSHLGFREINLYRPFLGVYTTNYQVLYLSFYIYLDNYFILTLFVYLILNTKKFIMYYFNSLVWDYTLTLLICQDGFPIQHLYNLSRYVNDKCIYFLRYIRFLFHLYHMSSLIHVHLFIGFSSTTLSYLS